MRSIAVKKLTSLIHTDRRAQQPTAFNFFTSWSAKRGDRYGLDCPSVLPSVCYIVDSIISTKTVLRSCDFRHTLTLVLANQRVVQKFDRGSTPLA